jgi:hypothetical protein
MGGLVLGADVGLDLDDPARTVVADESSPDQGPSRIERRSGEEPPVEGPGLQARITTTGS